MFYIKYIITVSNQLSTGSSQHHPRTIFAWNNSKLIGWMNISMGIGGEKPCLREELGGWRLAVKSSGNSGGPWQWH